MLCVRIFHNILLSKNICLQTNLFVQDASDASKTLLPIFSRPARHSELLSFIFSSGSWHTATLGLVWSEIEVSLSSFKNAAITDNLLQSQFFPKVCLLKEKAKKHNAEDNSCSVCTISLLGLAWKMVDQ